MPTRATRKSTVKRRKAPAIKRRAPRKTTKPELRQEQILEKLNMVSLIEPVLRQILQTLENIQRVIESPTADHHQAAFYKAAYEKAKFELDRVKSQSSLR